MEKKVTITLDSYNLRSWRDEIVWKCVHDNPSATLGELCKLLDITRDTLRCAFRRAGIKYDAYKGSGEHWPNHVKRLLKSSILPKDLEQITKFIPKNDGNKKSGQ